MPDENRLPLLHPSSLTLHSDASPPSNPTTSPTVDTPTNKTQPASLHSYRLPSSSSLVPAASYTVYQPPPSTFHTSQPRPPPLLLIPSTPSSHSSTSSHAFPHPPPPLATPLTAIPMALDTILVRTAHRFSWSSFHHQYLFPLTVPTFASPHLPSYVSPSEWSTSIHHLNSALRWPLRVQLARLLLSLLTLLAFCAIWSHEVRERRTYTIACWVGLIGAGLSLVVLTKVYGQRVRRRLEAAVEAENRYYEGRGGVMSTQGGGGGGGGGGRDNRLACSWRLDEAYLVVSAPTVGPLAHYGPLTIARTQQPSPPHDYQHRTPYSSRQEPLHTPMEHF